MSTVECVALECGDILNFYAHQLRDTPGIKDEGTLPQLYTQYIKTTIIIMNHIRCLRTVNNPRTHSVN